MYVGGRGRSSLAVAFLTGSVISSFAHQMGGNALIRNKGNTSQE